MSTTDTMTKSQTGQRAFSEGLRDHMNQVYGVMALGTLLTFLAAWSFGTSEQLLAYIYNPESLKPTVLGWIAMLSPLAIVFYMSFRVESMSASKAKTVFYIFATIMGISMSSIFVVYTGSSIAQVFLVTAIAFASLSLWGYTTKKDISAWGSFLFMGLIGLIGAMILNIFMGSTALDFAITVIGVLIFAGLTAYDTQKIKNEYLQHAHAADDEWLSKAATMAALDLYLDFINLFLMLLRAMGERK